MPPLEEWEEITIEIGDGDTLITVTFQGLKLGETTISVPPAHDKTLTLYKTPELGFVVHYRVKHIDEPRQYDKRWITGNHEMQDFSPHSTQQGFSKLGHAVGFYKSISLEEAIKFGKKIV